VICWLVSFDSFRLNLNVVDVVPVKVGKSVVISTEPVSPVWTLTSSVSWIVEPSVPVPESTTCWLPLVASAGTVTSAVNCAKLPFTLTGGGEAAPE